MKRYELSETLGDGTYGSVLKGLNRETHEIVAIKKMKKKFYSWRECKNLREVRSLRKLCHPNIIKLKEVIRENNELFFVFEYMDLNLYELLKQKQKMNPPGFKDRTIRNILSQCFQSLDYMHKNGFFHRDIKPENILIRQKRRSDGSYDDASIVCKMADFGLAREIRSAPPYTDYVSTRWYRAPEVLLRKNNYSTPIDTWAMGAIMAELYALRPLFPGSSEPDQLYKICTVLGKPTSLRWAEGVRLAEKMHFRFPEFDPTPLGTLIPSCPGDGIKLMEALLRFDPMQRPSSSAILADPYFKAGSAPRFTPSSSRHRKRNRQRNNQLMERKQRELREPFDERSSLSDLLVAQASRPVPRVTKAPLPSISTKIEDSIPSERKQKSSARSLPHSRRLRQRRNRDVSGKSKSNEIYQHQISDASTGISDFSLNTERTTDFRSGNGPRTYQKNRKKKRERRANLKMSHERNNSKNSYTKDIMDDLDFPSLQVNKVKKYMGPSSHRQRQQPKRKEHLLFSAPARSLSSKRNSFAKPHGFRGNLGRKILFQ